MSNLQDKLGMALLGEFLSEWPDDMSFLDVISALEDYSSACEPWYAYERWDKSDLAKHITAVVDRLVKAAEL